MGATRMSKRCFGWRQAGVTGILAAGGLILLFWLLRIEEKVARSRSLENLRGVAGAFQKYREVEKRCPPAVIYDKNGRALHSWRVLILPYLGEETLYRQFHLDESWESPHNLQLLSKIPPAFVSARPGRTKDPFGTHFQVFVFEGYPGWHTTYYALDNGKTLKPITLDNGRGKHSLFESRLGPGGWFHDSVWFLAEAEQEVPWTKPADLVVHPQKPLPNLGGLFDDGFHVAARNSKAGFIKWERFSKSELGLAIMGDGLFDHPDW